MHLSVSHDKMTKKQISSIILVGERLPTLQYAVEYPGLLLYEADGIH